MSLPASPLTLTDTSLAPTRPPASVDDSLRDALKRCSARTQEAARRYRQHGDVSQIPVVVAGIVERFVEPELRSRLIDRPENLRLVEDLGLDSLTLMEIVLLTEDVLNITVNADELRHFRTLGDVDRFAVAKARGLTAVAAVA